MAVDNQHCQLLSLAGLYRVKLRTDHPNPHNYCSNLTWLQRLWKRIKNKQQIEKKKNHKNLCVSKTSNLILLYNFVKKWFSKPYLKIRQLNERSTMKDKNLFNSWAWNNCVCWSSFGCVWVRLDVCLWLYACVCSDVFACACLKVFGRLNLFL